MSVLANAEHDREGLEEEVQDAVQELVILSVWDDARDNKALTAM